MRQLHFGVRKGREFGEGREKPSKQFGEKQPSRRIMTIDGKSDYSQIGCLSFYRI